MNPPDWIDAATVIAVISIAGNVVQWVKRSDAVTGFKVLPRRWVVERTFHPPQGSVAAAEDGSPGPVATAGLPRTSRPPSPAPRPSS